MARVVNWICRGASVATLSFDYARVNFDDAGDFVTLEISADGGANWTELDRFVGAADDTTLQSAAYDISPYAAPDTQIRLISTQTSGSDDFFIDDFRVSFAPELEIVEPIPVNTTTGGIETTTAGDRGNQQAVALSADGSYVVAWSAQDPGTLEWDVYARRFDRLGQPLTGEILINQTTAGDQQWARVAADSTGNFVVTWTDDSSGDSDVLARLFTPSGAATSTEFVVNASTAGEQHDSTIDMDSDGDFIIAWQGEGPGDPDDGIFYRRFMLNGAAIDGTDQLANATDRGPEQDAAVTLNDDGSFAIAWATTDDIYVQAFAADGSLTGSERNVNLTSASHPAIDSDAAGNFTVVYRVGSGVWGRGYNADGTQRYGWFQVDGGDSDYPSIAMTPDGQFVVTYQRTSTDEDVRARAFEAGASSYAEASVVHSLTSGDQVFAAVDAISPHNFVVVYSGEGPGDTSGVFAAQIGIGAPQLLLSTDKDVDPTDGADGLVSWGKDEILGFGDPSFDLGNSTRGTFSSQLDWANFGAAGATTNSMHRVRSNFTVGSGADSFSLMEGDLLLSIEGTGTVSGTSTSISIDKEDLFVFRPDVTDNYGAGEFYFLLDDPMGAKIHAMTVVESSGVTIGNGPALAQGTFLIAKSGGGDHDDLYTYLPATVGPSSTTSVLGPQMLIDGENGNLNFTDKIIGAHVIVADITLGGVDFVEGDLLLTVDKDQLNADGDGIGGTTLQVRETDIFRLRMTETQQGPTNQSNGEAIIAFDGSDVGLSSTDEAINALSFAYSVTNLAPTLSLDNTVTTLPETTDTSSGVVVADIVLSDDGLGTNNVSLSGTNPGLFEISGGQLHLVAGTSLDFESLPTLQVTVEVDDPTVGASPDDSQSLVIAVSDVNEPPTIDVTVIQSTVAEDITLPTTVATFAVSDDGLGSANVTLTGADASSFQIVGSDIQLIGPVDFETAASLSFTLEVDDTSVGASPDDSQTTSITITDVNEPPTLDLTIVQSAVSEDATLPVTVATFSIDDDALGSESVTLTGADASLFQIVGSDIQLIGPVDFETAASLSFTLEVDDTSVGASPDDSQTTSITITDVNEPPTLDLTVLQSTVPEDVALPVTVATFVINDDALGSESVTLTGADASLFQIVGNDIQLIGPVDFETAPLLSFTVELDDPSIGSTPDDSQTQSITITDVNEAPTVVLTILQSSVAEDASLPIPVATFAITDDALGSETVTLSGADASLFPDCRQRRATNRPDRFRNRCDFVLYDGSR